jgi:citrate lyase beta subunit
VALRELIAAHRQLIPGVRIGATDLCGYWGLRRPPDVTIHELAAIRDIVGDVVNVLGRDADAPPISGSVWEYVRDLHGGHAALSTRSGLVRETVLDRANGLHGKSVIHPTHVGVVDALHCVTHEEWASANAVLEASDGGVVAPGGPRMNEARPHARWAGLTLARADAFGVLAPDTSVSDLLACA